MNLDFDESFDLSNYGGKHKLFVVKPVTISYSYGDVPDASTETGKAVQALLKTDWEHQMQTFKSQKEKEYRQILAVTEDNIMKSAAKEKEKWEKEAAGDEGGGDKVLKKIKTWLDEEVKGAAVMIDNALKTFLGVAKKAMETLWAKCVDAVEKKFKQKTTWKQVKAVTKILAWSGIAVGVAAASIVVTGLGIALTVVSHGAGAAVLVPAVIGAAAATISTLVKAGVTIVTSANQIWPSHRKAQVRVSTATSALQAAVELSEKKQNEGLSIKESLTFAVQNSAAKRKELSDALTDLEEWTKKMALTVQQNQIMATKLKKEHDGIASGMNDLDDEGKKLIAKDVDDLGKKVTYWETKIQAADKVIGQYDVNIKAATDVLKDAENIKSSALTKIYNKFTELAKSDEISILVSAGQAALTAAVGIGKAAMSLQKALA